MSERVEEIKLDREGIAHFFNEQHQGWHDGMGGLSQTRVYGTALLLADAVRAALAQAERERDEARAERNARARDVMHLEAEVERLREDYDRAHYAWMDAVTEKTKAEREHKEQLAALMVTWEAKDADLARVRAALERYGEHTMRCNAWGPGPAARECTCGLRAALEGRG